MSDIYLDNAATTRVDDEVAEKIKEVMLINFGNASSLHKKGYNAFMTLEKAKSQIMDAIGAKTGNIYFTSGGTEADNLAILGLAKAKQKLGKRVIVSSIEHSAVLESARELKKEGFDVIEVDPDENGKITVEILEKYLNQDTILVSIMLANNEIGTIQDIKELVKLTRKISKNAAFHCDAVQAFGKVNFKVKDLGVDALSISGHKIHCCKGIGALYLADKVRVIPRVFGGEQQDKIRPGTESTPLIAGFGLASKKAIELLDENNKKIKVLKEALIEKLEKIPEVKINSPRDSSFYVLNISVCGFRSETLLHFLSDKEIYVSSGSACAKGEKSHVLKALGLEDSRIDSAIRVSFCKYNTIEEIEVFADAILEATNKLTRNNKR